MGSLTINLGLLAIFKYLDFLIESWNWASLRISGAPEMDTFGLLLPVGISFYTFQSLSYIIDIYRGSLQPSKTLKEYAFFVSFFPALVAGCLLYTSDAADE